MKSKLFNIPVLAVAIALTTGSCVKDYVDPGRATEDQLVKDVKGLTGAATGLQRAYSVDRTNLYNRVTASGFLSNELFLLNQGNTAEFQLSVGGDELDGRNTLLAGLWSRSNKIIRDADLIISSARDLSDQSVAGGIIAYTTIFKALAIGDLAMFWEQVPNGTGENVTFIPRKEGYQRAITAIDDALAAIATNPISSAFLSSIPAGIDIPNTLQALKARYALFAEDYELALTAAQAVDLSKSSAFNYDALAQNPIFSQVTSTNNIWQPIDDTLGLPEGLQPDEEDKRVDFYLDINEEIAPRFRVGGFGSALNQAWPIYLPGEITLIKAEAYARQSSPDYTSALAELNKVVTKSPEEDVFGVGADLGALGTLSPEDLLAAIYKHRSIELFMSGLRLEDSRRLGRPQSERKRNFVNYPFAERDQNSNTPADPAF